MLCAINEVISEFECPICHEFMQPPIRQCATGHSFCHNCFNAIQTCSICTSVKGVGRNFTLEKLLEKLKFPCKYAENGCVEILKVTEIQDHIGKCDNRNINCLINENCNWNFKLASLEDHIKEQHGNYFYLHKKNYLGLITEMESKEISIHKARNELFVLVLQPKDSILRWSVYHFGKHERTEKFSYEVNIKNKIVMRVPCLHSCTYRSDNTDKSIMVYLKDLNDYLGKDNKLHFDLAILQTHKRKLLVAVTESAYLQFLQLSKRLKKSSILLE